MCAKNASVRMEVVGIVVCVAKMGSVCWANPTGLSCCQGAAHARWLEVTRRMGGGEGTGSSGKPLPLRDWAEILRLSAQDDT